MEEFSKSGRMELSALRADMDRTTARKYLPGGRMPSERRIDRTWSTRKNPFADVWTEDLLGLRPGIEA